MIVTVKFLKIRTQENFCSYLRNIQTKSPNVRVLSQKEANGIANSEYPDQTAPLGAV